MMMHNPESTLVSSTRQLMQPILLHLCAALSQDVGAKITNIFFSIFVVVVVVVVLVIDFTKLLS